MYDKIITTITVIIAALALAAQLYVIEPHTTEPEPWPPAVLYRV